MTSTPMGHLADTIFHDKYSLDGLETWEQTAWRVASNVVGPYFPDAVGDVAKAISDRKFMPGGRYLYAAGRPVHQVNSCFLFDVGDSKEEWARLMHRVTLALMTGGGTGTVYSKLRGRGSRVNGMGGFSTGPTSLMQMVNEAGRHIVQGGSRRAAMWAGLHWDHPDIMEYIHLKDWSEDIRRLREKDFNFPAPLDMTNISVILDDGFFTAYEAGDSMAQRVYNETVMQMLTTGEPGFSIDTGENAGESHRNPCQPADATVITPNGLGTMGELSIGDKIWSKDGWVTVTNKQATGVKDVYRYHTTVGFVDCTENHRVVQEGVKVEARDATSIDRLAGPLEAVCSVESRGRKDSSFQVNKVEYLGQMPVFDITVSGSSHTYWSGGHDISNCTEITSADDNDVCSLGSINLARVGSVQEMDHLTELGTMFLMCGTLYSRLPFPEVESTRAKNRRLGLGLMGVYEWLTVRGKDYAPDPDLAEIMESYAKSTDYAAGLADSIGVSRPVKTRAIAPTGTISMLAETTSGIEPLFSVATKRRYLKAGTATATSTGTWVYQYVVDSAAQRLIDEGINPDKMPTAYEMAKNPDQRISFQAWMQRYVDHGISSTINLPAWEEQTFSEMEFGDTLMKHLPNLRGVTAYPNGSRGGQPLNAVPYEEAVGQVGVEFEETSAERACVSGVCGI